jgi:hypothetical protein
MGGITGSPEPASLRPMKRYRVQWIDKADGFIFPPTCDGEYEASCARAAVLSAMAELREQAPHAAHCLQARAVAL